MFTLYCIISYYIYQNHIILSSYNLILLTNIIFCCIAQCCITLYHVILHSITWYHILSYHTHKMCLYTCKYIDTHTFVCIHDMSSYCILLVPRVWVLYAWHAERHIIYLSWLEFKFIDTINYTANLKNMSTISRRDMSRSSWKVSCHWISHEYYWMSHSIWVDY